MKARGKILDYGIELIEAPETAYHQMPKVKVKFELSDKENIENGFKYDTIYWDGLFVNAKKELNIATAKNLIQMGFNQDDPIVLSEGPESESLDMNRLYYLELEVNDKGYWQVKWINQDEFTGGMKEIKKASKDLLREKMASLKIKGDLKKMFESQPKKEENESTGCTNINELFNAADQVPF